MQRSFLLSVAMLLCCPAAYASEPAQRITPAQFQPVHARRMSSLAPSLRQWVVEEGRRRVEAGPDAGAIGESVRVRLAGQEFTDGDVDLLVQAVLMESAQSAQADLRAEMAEMQANNRRKQAQRESAHATAKAAQAPKAESRDSYGQRTQVPPPTTTAEQVDAELVDPAEAEKESISDLSQENLLRLQAAQERYEKFMTMLSNVMKKSSDTASSIVSNLK